MAEGQGISIPNEVLGMLDSLKTKVKARDEEKVRKGQPLTMANVETPEEPKLSQKAGIPTQQANDMPGTMRTTT